MKHARSLIGTRRVEVRILIGRRWVRPADIRKNWDRYRKLAPRFLQHAGK